MAGDDTDLPEDCPDDLWWESILRRWETVLELARERLTDGDAAMV